MDVNISCDQDKFLSGIFCKKTFPGLGLNFFRFCFNNLKVNSCKTLFFRAYSICSNWLTFHEEVNFLSEYFNQNCYPKFLVEWVLNKFLSFIFNPKPQILTVPKKLLYISLPFSTKVESIKRELITVLNKLYPYVEFKFIFENPLTIGSLFSFKDSLTDLMWSSVIYKFT